MALPVRKTLVVSAVSLLGLSLTVPALAQSGALAPIGINTERSERIKVALEPLVSDATISQEQADAVADRLAEAAPARAGKFRADIAAVAEVLGLTPAELLSKVKGGQTLAEIAAEQGVAVEDVVAVIVAHRQEKLDEKVAEGDLTQQEADEKVADITERATEAVTEGTLPLGGREGGRGGHHDGVPKHLSGSAEVAAETLGLTVAELAAKVQAGQTLAEVAAEQGVATQTLIDALVAHETTKINEAQAAGKLTAEQAAEKIAALPTYVAERVNGTAPLRGEKGPRGDKGSGVGRADEAAAVAEVLGLTVEELRAERVAGKSLAAIAGEQGVAVQSVIDAIVAVQKERLDAAVAAGTLTQADADAKLATITEKVTAMVNSTGPLPGEHGHRRGGPRGHAGAGEFGAEAPAEETATA